MPTHPQSFPPAKPKLIVALLCLAAVFIIGFTAALSIDLQIIRSLDPADYTETTLEQFAYDATATMDGAKIAITGWACIAGEQIDAVETDIALYLPATGEYLLLPTEMQQTDAATAALGTDQDYSYSGFYATCYPFQLDADLADYEVCISYRTNFKNALIHTGLFLEVAA